MYCKAKLRLPLKSILEEYKCGKARLLSMLEESEDPVVKTVQPTIKTGTKWKVAEAVDEVKECLKIKDVIGQTQTDRKGLGSSTAKLWSKADGKKKRDMVINEIWLNEDSRRVQKAVQQPQQGQWTNWDNALQKSLTWNEIWQWRHFGSAFSYDLLQIWYGGERKRTGGGAKSWHTRLVRTTNQIKCLLDGCDDWDVSADLPEWDSHPSIIKETRLRPDIMIHSASTQLIMVELTVPYKNRMEEAHIYKREKYMNLTKELENARYKAVVMPVEVGATGFVGSSVYDLLT